MKVLQMDNHGEVWNVLYLGTQYVFISEYWGIVAIATREKDEEGVRTFSLLVDEDNDGEENHSIRELIEKHENRHVVREVKITLWKVEDLNCKFKLDCKVIAL